MVGSKHIGGKYFAPIWLVLFYLFFLFGGFGLRAFRAFRLWKLGIFAPGFAGYLHVSKIETLVACLEDRDIGLVAQISTNSDIQGFEV